MKRIVNLGISLLMTTSLFFIVVLAFFFLCLNKNFILDKMDSYNYYDAIIDGYQSKISDKINDDKVLDVVINLFDKDMVKEGSVIVDVGISREDGKLYGDVNPNVSEKCSYLTPVPGGVGPMTVAMLVKNTLIAYKKINNQ